MASGDNKKILCVGLCCLDIISVVRAFPKEDTDQRSLDYYWQRGGNASNSSTILALLGADVEFLGTLVKSQEYGFLKSSFSKCGIGTDHCPVFEEGEVSCPVAVVIVNQVNGSRTILAALNNIRELKYEDFEKVNLQGYKWIHFEGRRNVEDVERMIHRVRDFNQSQTADCCVKVSLELEKVKRTELIPLMQYVDFAFVSKEFAIGQGYSTMEDAVRGLELNCCDGGSVICGWGDKGAAAKTVSHDLVTSPIFPPEKLIDTLGAGDTFNAATILALSKGKTLQDSIIYGCKIAGAKCGMTGYDSLKALNNLL